MVDLVDHVVDAKTYRVMGFLKDKLRDKQEHSSGLMAFSRISSGTNRNIHSGDFRVLHVILYSKQKMNGSMVNIGNHLACELGCFILRARKSWLWSRELKEQYCTSRREMCSCGADRIVNAAQKRVPERSLVSESHAGACSSRNQSNHSSVRSGVCS
jgi:hypothetical protein